MLDILLLRKDLDAAVARLETRKKPPAFLDFVKGWGQDKVIWATDYPLVSFKRAREDVDSLGLPLDVKKKLLRENFLRALKRS